MLRRSGNRNFELWVGAEAAQVYAGEQQISIIGLSNAYSVKAIS